ncbi:MAG: SGNH/GDSL hydrolase family protein [Candidatus Binatia bacterium]|nr:SGNH/GDSL hydrolase family protein [Candidatus Binatia bacterium]
MSRWSRGLLGGVFAAFAFASACAPVLHEPAPRLIPPGQESRWLLRCEKVRSVRHDHRIPGKTSHWLWARDEQGLPVAVTGTLQDGFLVVARNTPRKDPSVRNVGFNDLREICQKTIRQSKRGAFHSLGHVRAARRREGINVPLLAPRPRTGQEPVTRVVVFGDSLSDSGKLKNRLRIFPGRPYWIGRFSNGPNWADYLERILDVPVQNHAYGGASVHPTSLMSGENMITKMAEEGQFFVSGSLGLQIEDYTERFLESGTIDHPDKTIFLFWGGANDYLAKIPFDGTIQTLLDRPMATGGYQTIARRVIQSMEEQILHLYEAGARRFIVLNLPDLGATPIVLQNNTYTGEKPDPSPAEKKIALASRLSQLSEFHNQELAAALGDLRAKLPEAEILSPDTAALFASILDSNFTLDESGTPFDLGFDITSQRVDVESDTGSIQLQDRCFTGGYLGSPRPEDICANADRVLFWDTIHPTTFAHCWQAYFIARELQDAGWWSGLTAPEAHKARCLEFQAREYAPDP